MDLQRTISSENYQSVDRYIMGLIQLLATAWPVWKIATKRIGPVGRLVVTVVVVGLLY